MRRFFRCLLTVSLASTASSHHAFATSHALLVGVSGYPALPQEMRLRGPANDVDIMRNALAKAGIAQQNITVLADHVPNASALPTRAHILQAFERLTKFAKPGDWVVVYFAGHGSRQPQIKPGNASKYSYREPDGLDEIFLPYDIGAWDGGIGAIRGAIVDDEIDAALERITRQGAHVWALFDTCHAAGMAKASGPRNQASSMRHVTPERLGVPKELMQEVWDRQGTGVRTSSLDSSPVPAEKSIRARGTRVTFYAAQKDEPAQEELFPVPDEGAKGERRYYGLFTYHTVNAIRRWHGSFKELADDISERYRQRPFPTPRFEGDLAQAPKFSRSP